MKEPTVTRRTWEITVDGKPHQIRLRHGYWSGKREVWVDNQLVIQRKKFGDYGSRYSFDIDNHIGSLKKVRSGSLVRINLKKSPPINWPSEYDNLLMS